MPNRAEAKNTTPDDEWFYDKEEDISIFAWGYSEGYLEQANTSSHRRTKKERRLHDEGFNEGADDKKNKRTRRYYIGTPD